jgi:hypothetical protein
MLHQYYYSDEIKDDEMTEHTKFWSEKLKGRNLLEDLSIDGRITSE